MAICPTPAINVSALGVNGRLDLVNSLDMAPGNGFMEAFGAIIEAENMTSEQVLAFYKELLFSQEDVTLSAVALLENGDKIDLTNRVPLYFFPTFEAGDCPVVKVPAGISGVTQIR